MPYILYLLGAHSASYLSTVFVYVGDMVARSRGTHALCAYLCCQ